MKTAIVTGISGQDGAYLAKLLLENNYKVIGGERSNASGTLSRLEKLGILDDIEFANFELTEMTNIMRLLEKYRPDEFYNLAAQSFVAASFELPVLTGDVTGLGVGRVLEAIRHIKSDTKFYQASSSEMYGKVAETPQNENTPFFPRSPYAAAKCYGHWLTVNYRESYDIFACSGIMFNHESPLRGANFVTRKITLGLSKIKLGKRSVPLQLGNLDAKRDWGYAGDYVIAMHKMLSHTQADDYVISTGETHSVREFIEICAKFLNFDISWSGKGLDEVGIDTKSGKKLISINAKYFRPTEVDLLLGNSSKAKQLLNWEPKILFEELVAMMVDSDLKDLEKVKG